MGKPTATKASTTASKLWPTATSSSPVSKPTAAAIFTTLMNSRCTASVQTGKQARQSPPASANNTASFTSSAPSAGRPAPPKTAASNASVTPAKTSTCQTKFTPTATVSKLVSHNRSTNRPPKTLAATPSNNGIIITANTT